MDEGEDKEDAALWQDDWDDDDVEDDFAKQLRYSTLSCPPLTSHLALP